MSVETSVINVSVEIATLVSYTMAEMLQWSCNNKTNTIMNFTKLASSKSSLNIPLVFIVISTSHFFFHSAESSQSIVKTLPGFLGNLPFKLETGYVTLGENEDTELFYYFVESERNPGADPLFLWLTGGPGCSGLSGLVFEIGPIAFDASTFNGSLPSFILREHSWTKVANVIFIDSPVGTGFSYWTRTESSHTSDTLSTKDTYTFLRRWLLSHPRFIKNRLYIAGDSYGGKMVPMVVFEVLKGNEAGLEPQMYLQGYMIGNPITSDTDSINARVPYAHRMALISDEYYASAKKSCSGQYVDVDPKNEQCIRALDAINNCIQNLYPPYILGLACSVRGSKMGKILLEDDWRNIHHEPICRDDVNGMISYAWANNPAVQDALHVRKGTSNKWKRCKSFNYEEDVPSAVPYHRALMNKNIPALVFSGDHDLMAPYIATLKRIHHLNMTLVERWRPWNGNGQIAGYTQRYNKDGFSLTFATIKGGGHTAPEYNPEQCLAMVDRWLSSYPL